MGLKACSNLTETMASPPKRYQLSLYDFATMMVVFGCAILSYRVVMKSLLGGLILAVVLIAVAARVAVERSKWGVLKARFATVLAGATGVVLMGSVHKLIQYFRYGSFPPASYNALGSSLDAVVGGVVILGFYGLLSWVVAEAILRLAQSVEKSRASAKGLLWLLCLAGMGGVVLHLLAQLT